MDEWGRRRWRTAACLVATATLGLVSACGRSSISSPPTSVAPIGPGHLLDLDDLPGGWVVGHAIDATAVEACSAPPTTSSIVGRAGTGVQYLQGSTELVEYAVRSATPASAYTSAIQRLEDQRPCSATVDGRTESATFDQVIPLPRYGDDSVGMLVGSDADGTTSQAGYAIVRQRSDVLVVGYTGPGPLDTAALEQFTEQALAKLGS